MSEIGIRLREVRRDKGLDQAAFGALGGVNRNTQSKYESGERSPDTDYLLKLQSFGIDIAYLVTGLSSKALSSDESEMLALVRQLDEDDRGIILALMRSLRKKVVPS